MKRSAKLQQEDAQNEVIRLTGGWEDVAKCHDIANGVQQLFQELHEIVGELREAEAANPGLGHHSLMELDLPLKPAKKKADWRRLLIPSKPSSSPQVEKVLVWWGVTMADTEKGHLRIHLGVEDGRIYSQLTRHGKRYLSRYSNLTECCAANLSLTTLESLVKGIQYKRKILVQDRRDE